MRNPIVNPLSELPHLALCALRATAMPARTPRFVLRWPTIRQAPAPPPLASARRRSKASPSPLRACRVQRVDRGLRPTRAIPHPASATAARLHQYPRALNSRPVSTPSFPAPDPQEFGASLPQPPGRSAPDFETAPAAPV